jgi:dihydroorotate dehydrogenase
VVRHLYRQSRGTLPIIGVGGVFSAADAWEKIAAGAALVQLYTGLVFEGPTVVRQIVEGLRDQLAASGYSDLRQAVGHAAQNQAAPGSIVGEGARCTKRTKSTN